MDFDHEFHPDVLARTAGRRARRQSAAEAREAMASLSFTRFH